MGSFSNGSEGMCYENMWCNKCAHNDEEKGCPVWMAHFAYAYGAKGDAKKILDILIPYENGCNKKCEMFFDKALLGDACTPLLPFATPSAVNGDAK